MNKRPLSVVVVGCVYIAAGVIGFVYHFSELKAGGSFQYGVLWIEVIRLVAILCGVFLLLGHNWARWGALAWMGLHVVISAFHSLSELVTHCLFFVVIAWLLFRRGTTQYFLSRSTNQQTYGNAAGG